MAGIVHAKTSAIEDGADATLVRPSDWNAAHLGLATVRKTADETVNNSTDLQNDNHLLLAVGANEIWIYFILLKIVTTAVADFKFTMTVPTAGASNVQEVGQATALLNWYTATLGLGLATASDRTNAHSFIFGIYVGGANAGNLQLQWAQNTAEATDTKVLTNSCIVAFKIA